MKKKCVLGGILSIVVCGVTACGSILPTESVMAKELEIIVVKDEPVVPRAHKPDEVTVVETQADVAVGETATLSVEKIIEETNEIMGLANLEAEVADGRVDASDFAVDVRGTVVKMDEEINGLMNTLGTPDSFVETVSNPKIGSDKKYIYNGIVIYTNPENGRDIVNGIEYCGEEKTPSGIGIGSTRADIEAAYGIDYVMDPDYITYMYSENATISFCMDDEECVGIAFSWK